MEAFSIAMVIIACIAGYLVNKFIDIKYRINTNAADAALSAATIEMHKQFDSRINKAFENHQIIKSELDSLKLQIGIRNK
jgi:hypothetical protein